MSGKAEKKFNNEKAASNEAIEASVLKHFTKFAEMPQYVANIAHGVEGKYRSQIQMMATHFGLIAANMKQIEKEIKASSISKASKDKILEWMEPFKAEGEL
jgi:hypothetical protein